MSENNNLMTAFLISLIICSYSCTKEDMDVNTLSYPSTFVYSQFDYNPSMFYNIGLDTYIQLSTPDIDEWQDSFLQNELMPDSTSAFSRIIYTFLSDSTVNLSDGMSQNTTVPYSKIDPSTILLSGYLYRFNNDFNELRLCYQTISYRPTSFLRFISDGCTTLNVTSILDDVASEYSLAQGDTILLNLSDYVYELE